MIIIKIKDRFMRRLETEIFFFHNTERENKVLPFRDKTYDAALRADYESYFNLGVSNL